MLSVMIIISVKGGDMETAHRYSKKREAILEAMRYICLCEPKKLLSFSIGPENMKALASLTEAYLTTQLERGFATLDFYKSLFIQ